MRIYPRNFIHISFMIFKKFIKKYVLWAYVYINFSFQNTFRNFKYYYSFIEHLVYSSRIMSKNRFRNYSILYPHQCEYKYARKMRCSPLYSVLETRGAVFGIKMAYERALYFDSSYKDGDSRPQMPPGTFFKPKFFDFMMEEYLACREGVGIIDMSSFSKIEIKVRTPDE